MPNQKALSVTWTSQSLFNTISIKNYLLTKFTHREVDRFFILLETFEAAVLHFPNLYPETKKKTKIRRAVLSKQLSIYYRISNNNIQVLAVLDNRCDSSWINDK